MYNEMVTKLLKEMDGNKKEKVLNILNNSENIINEFNNVIKTLNSDDINEFLNRGEFIDEFLICQDSIYKKIKSCDGVYFMFLILLIYVKSNNKYNELMALIKSKAYWD